MNEVRGAVAILLFLVGVVFGADVTPETPPPGSCSPVDTPIPRRLEADKPPRIYPLLEGGLQIFLDYELCDGFITEFRFLTAETVTWGLHFGVFRRAFVTNFRLVNEYYVNGVSTNVPGDAWAIVRPSTPFAVKKGDYFGMFYNELSDRPGRRSIRSMTMQPTPAGNTSAAGSNFAPMSEQPRLNTIVFIRNASSMVVNKTLLDEGDGQLIARYPAVYIILSRFPNSLAILSSNSDAYRRVFGSPQTTRSQAVDSSLQFRDLKCNLLPNLYNRTVWNQCGERLTVRYFFSIERRQCFSFYGCDLQHRSSQVTSNAESEDSWNNNFADSETCMNICRDAKNLRRRLSTDSTTSDRVTFYAANSIDGP